MANKGFNNQMNEKYVLRVPMGKHEKMVFLKAFNKSGFKTMSEFIRHMIRQYVSKV